MSEYPGRFFHCERSVWTADGTKLFGLACPDTEAHVVGIDSEGEWVWCEYIAGLFEVGRLLECMKELGEMEKGVPESKSLLHAMLHFTDLAVHDVSIQDEIDVGLSFVDIFTDTNTDRRLESAIEVSGVPTPAPRWVFGESKEGLKDMDVVKELRLFLNEEEEKGRTYLDRTDSGMLMCMYNPTCTVPKNYQQEWQEMIDTVERDGLPLVLSRIWMGALNNNRQTPISPFPGGQDTTGNACNWYEMIVDTSIVPHEGMVVPMMHSDSRPRRWRSYLLYWMIRHLYGSSHCKGETDIIALDLMAWQLKRL